MKKYILASLLSVLFLTVSCNKSDDSDISENFNATEDDKLNFFIWKGLNLYYLWQEDVPNLADDRFTNLGDLYTFFSSNSAPEETFNSLLNEYGTIDRFSWIVDDYVALENSFQGINLSTGIDFGLVYNKNSSSNIFGYVRYIIPNSPAAISGITRGMYFNTVNGIQLTDTNYRSLLFGEDTSLSFGLADYNSGNPISNNTNVSLSKTEIQEDPIANYKIIPDGTKKIGYLLYNQFASSFDQALNSVFSDFKAAAIDDLIIDLRYNSGGSTNSASYLGSMVTGQFPNEIYSKEVWNGKITDYYGADSFINMFPTRIIKKDSNNNVLVDEAINSLNLQRVYFIVTESSASASELVINSLNAHIDVKLVGTKTVGKQVGSVTLYDSDNLRRSGNNLNPAHTYAMQPLVLEIKNKNDENYPNGIIPGDNFTGINLAERIGDLGVLGERSDMLLDKTLEYISTGSKAAVKKDNLIRPTIIFNSKMATPAGETMYSKIK